jgi:vancomycin resistance protein YoaR
VSQISQTIKNKPIKLSGIWLPVLLVVVAGGILAFVIFGMLAYQLFYLDRIYPGVLVDGLEAGGLAPADVVRAVATRSHEQVARPITVHAGEKTWTFTSLDLGMQVDAAATADQAYAVGREGNLLLDMLIHLRLLTNPQNVEPIITYDTGPLNRTLQNLADEINYPPQNAQLIIHSDATVEVIPAERGRRMHPQATRAGIETALLANDPEPVQAVIQEVLPVVTAADLEPIRRQAEEFLRQALVFGLSADTNAAEWRIEPETLATMIDVIETVDTDGKPQFALKIDQEKFVPYFEEFAKAIDLEPADAELKFDTDTNQVTVVQPSREGRSLDVAALSRQLENLPETAGVNSSHYVELPVVVIAPAVSSKDLDSLGITELISESTSYFKGSSEGRVYNIALAASRFNGVVIPPLEVFSFNEHLGEVTKEAGFDESLIIYGNRTTVGIGGGVCQVSTTAFRTAFLGGFELVERWAHGYRVGWYETNSVPGLDATIYTPDVDFRFRNDTDHYLLIHTETDLDASTLTFRFYGTDTGREVLLSEPEIANLVKHGPSVYEKDSTLPKGTTKQIDWAIDGMDVTITRTVKAGDVTLHQDKLFSQYKPWRAVYKVGTGTGENESN